MNFQWLKTDVETPIVELRRYRLHPGRREALIDLFEERFIEPQEAVGAKVLGTFRTEADPDAFVWLRGFTHMSARKAALEAFYGGAVWQANRDAANATMIDSDDVHLLRAIAPEGGLPAEARLPRMGERTTAIRYTLLLSELRYPEWVGQYHLWLRLFLRKAGADPLASFATLPADNNFPRLPVWANRHVHLSVLSSAAPIPDLPRELRGMLRGEPERMVVSPTARSRLR
jgi:hypothetical protein